MLRRKLLVEAVCGQANREWLRNRWITHGVVLHRAARRALVPERQRVSGLAAGSERHRDYRATTLKHNLISILKLVVVAKKTGYVSFGTGGGTAREGHRVYSESYHPPSLHIEPAHVELQFQLPVGSHVLEWFFKRTRQVTTAATLRSWS